MNDGRIYTFKERLAEDMRNVEAVMEKTADRVDIWQDRIIYVFAKTLWDILEILEWIIRKEKL